MMLYTIHFSGVVLGLIIGFAIGRRVNFDEAPVVGSSHSDVTHVIVSDKTVEELIMGDDD